MRRDSGFWWGTNDKSYVVQVRFGKSEVRLSSRLPQLHIIFIYWSYVFIRPFWRVNRLQLYNYNENCKIVLYTEETC